MVAKQQVVSTTMTKLLYLEDSYARECILTIITMQDRQIILDKTVFYPSGCGQATGRMRNL